MTHGQTGRATFRTSAGFVVTFLVTKIALSPVVQIWTAQENGLRCVTNLTPTLFDELYEVVG